MTCTKKRKSKLVYLNFIFNNRNKRQTYLETTLEYSILLEKQQEETQKSSEEKTNKHITHKRWHRSHASRREETMNKELTKSLCLQQTYNFARPDLTSSQNQDDEINVGINYASRPSRRYDSKLMDYKSKIRKSFTNFFQEDNQEFD